ncbi:MAG: hypothetical protein JKY93_02565 [Gammaproteobacteria bacterium]|nr:hypothetical protein [Gammaproteobacteria bacterium]
MFRNNTRKKGKQVITSNYHNVSAPNKKVARVVKFDELLGLIDVLPDTVHLNIIGGQALTFWALYYQESYPEKFEDSALSMGTTDIDFVTDKQSMEICAEAWGVELTRPNPNDEVAAQIGKVELIWDGEEIIIDFLIDYVHPKRVKEGYLGCVKLSADRDINVLGPTATLLSKIGNILVLRRRTPNDYGQLRSAMMVVHCAILEAMDQQDYHEAIRYIRFALDIARSNRIGSKMYKQGIDLLEIIPDDLKELDARYIQKTLIPELEKIQLSRNI